MTADPKKTSEKMTEAEIIQAKLALGEIPGLRVTFSPRQMAAMGAIATNIHSRDEIEDAALDSFADDYDL